MILSAAEKCFVRKGFQGTTISEICAEASISPGHLYHYFESKDAIVASLAELRLQTASASLEKIMGRQDAIGSLVAMFEPTRDKATRQALVLNTLAEAVRNPAMAAILEEHSRGVLTQLSSFVSQGQADGQIDPGLDPDMVALVLYCVGDGSKSMLLRAPAHDSDKSLALIKTMLTRFLAPPTH